MAQTSILNEDANCTAPKGVADRTAKLLAGVSPWRSDQTVKARIPNAVSKASNRLAHMARSHGETLERARNDFKDSF